MSDMHSENTAAVAAAAAARHPTGREGSVLHWSRRFFYFTTLAGSAIFATYVLLRGTGGTFSNFAQWKDLLSGLPMRTPADWIANLGIGMHFFMGAVLVMAWPILFSSRIRTRHRTVHRWTGRIYVTAGLITGIGGEAYIITRGAFSRSASIAFSIWGAIVIVSSIMAYFHARARRFDLHRAWSIRLFAMVLGSWFFDIEYRAWKDLTGGVGVGAGNTFGPFDYAILYLFFVPNLLVAEVFIRHRHRDFTLARQIKWPAITALAITGLIFAYAIAATGAVRSGKYGEHLLQPWYR